MPRAVVPAFVLYSAVAVLAALGARVVAARAERTAVIQASNHRVIEPPVTPAGAIGDSVAIRRQAPGERAVSGQHPDTRHSPPIPRKAGGFKRGEK